MILFKKQIKYFQHVSKINTILNKFYNASKKSMNINKINNKLMLT